MCARVRQFLLPFLLAAAFAVGGCASKATRMAKQEQKILQENSRVTEERKMRALNYGDVSSKRGAEVLVWDPNKKFDPSRSGVGTARTFGTGGTRTKPFNYDQKVQSNTFLTRMFSRTKSNSASEKDFATGPANTIPKYTIPGTKIDAQKTMATKSLPAGDKTASTRDLHDGDRTFLGPERKKLGNAIDPKSLADWRSGGGETVVYGADGSVDKIGNLKKLSIDDVRELLNKNK